MKEKMSSIYRWRQKASRCMHFVLLPLTLFLVAVWWEALLDGPSAFTVQGGVIGFPLLIVAIKETNQLLCLPELSKDILQTDHGDTVKKVAEKIRNESLRYLAVFGANEKKICEYTELSTYTIYLDEVVDKLVSVLDETVIIFNHPIVNRDGYSRAFEEAELKTIVKSKIKTAIIVAPDMTYVLNTSEQLPTKRHWKKVKRFYKNATNKAKWFLVFGRSRKRLKSIKVIEDVAERMNWDFWYEEYQRENEVD